MVKNKHIKDKLPSAKNNQIRDKDPSKNLSMFLHFSFKYFDLSNEKFSILNRQTQYFIKVLERLKNICTLTVLEFLQSRSISLRAHKINWTNTTEPQGFSCLKNEQLKECIPYQFEISANMHERVHGFLIDNIFHVVWFDPEHKLYSKKK